MSLKGTGRSWGTARRWALGPPAERRVSAGESSGTPPHPPAQPATEGSPAASPGPGSPARGGDGGGRAEEERQAAGSTAGPPRCLCPLEGKRAPHKRDGAVPPDLPGRPPPAVRLPPGPGERGSAPRRPLGASGGGSAARRGRGLAEMDAHRGRARAGPGPDSGTRRGRPRYGRSGCRGGPQAGAARPGAGAGRRGKLRSGGPRPLRGGAHRPAPGRGAGPAPGPGPPRGSEGIGVRVAEGGRSVFQKVKRPKEKRQRPRAEPSASLPGTTACARPRLTSARHRGWRGAQQRGEPAVRPARGVPRRNASVGVHANSTSSAFTCHQGMQRSRRLYPYLCQSAAPYLTNNDIITFVLRLS